MSHKEPALLALLFFASGCGDVQAPQGAAACRAFTDGALLRGAAPTELVVVGVSPRFEGGSLQALSLATLAWRALPVEVTGDTVVRPLGDALALLNRAPGNQDNLTLYGPRSAARPSVCQVPLVTDAEAAAGATTFVNPHDVLSVDAATLYVTRHNLSSLAVVDVASGRTTRTIDLAPYAAPAAGAFPEALARVDREVWVTLGRHDNRADPTAPGAVARIDPTTHRVVATVALAHPNPYGPIVASPDGRARWITTFGSYNVVGDGAVEAVDVTTGRLLDPVVTEDEVRGNIDALAVLDARRVVLRVSAERQGSGALDDLRVVVFDRVTREATTWLRMASWGAAAPVVVGARVFVGDPGSGAFREGAGLRVYDLDGGALRATPLGMGAGLMPYDARPM